MAVVVILIALILPAAASAGIVVIYSDDWLFANGGNTAIANQIGAYFDRGKGGQFLDWTFDYWYAGNHSMGPVFTSYSKTVIDEQPTLEQMSGYDGIFLGLNGANNEAFKADLAEYVRGGGNVFIAAGYDANPLLDGAAWNDFLSPFGLAYGGLDWTHYVNNCSRHPCSITASTPLTGMPVGLYNNGHTVIDLTPGETQYSGIIATLLRDDGIRIPIGASSDVPEPGALPLAGAGLALLLLARRRVSRGKARQACQARQAPEI
jgi:hypothetical protein